MTHVFALSAVAVQI